MLSHAGLVSRGLSGLMTILVMPMMEVLPKIVLLRSMMQLVMEVQLI